jgi:hypothetical protein
MRSLLFILIKPPFGVRQLERQSRRISQQHVELIIVLLIEGFLKRTFRMREAQNVNFGS